MDLAAEEHLAAVAPRLSNADGVPQPIATREIRPPWRRVRETSLKASAKLQEVEVLQGSVMLVERATFRRLGGFDEEFFLYAEEDDLAHRIRGAGGSIAVALDEGATHIGEASSGHIDPEWRAAQRLRGRVLFIRKHYSYVESILGVLQGLWRVLPQYGPSGAARIVRIARRDARSLLPKGAAAEECNFGPHDRSPRGL
jgi:hypothetical protein